MSHGDYVVSFNSSDRWMEGTQLDITCNRDYRVIDGSVTVTCNGQGHWEPQSPECLRKTIIYTNVHVYSSVPCMQLFHKNLISELIVMREILTIPRVYRIARKFWRSITTAKLKICKNFLLAYIRMAMPYQTAKFFNPLIFLQ